MATQEEQIAILTESLNSLENESRKLLRAVQWSSKVRKILFAGMLLFALISAFLFYRLYNEIKNERLVAIQKIIAEQPEEFAQPLTKQIMSMAEQEGPYVAGVFRKQIEKDSKIYLAAFDKEQNELVTNLQGKLEENVFKSYATMLDENENMLREEFPILKDPEKMKFLRENMEEVYQKIGKRYYVDHLKDELQDLTVKLEKFPMSKPKFDNVPVNEQLATEFLELVRMMLVHSEHYVVPVEKIKTSAKKDEAKDDSDNDETTASTKD
jgi:hypothetical protein